MRRRWLWIAAGTCAILAFALGLTLRRAPYSFLDRFHPQRFKVPVPLWIDLGPGYPSRDVPVMTVLSFRKQDAGAVRDLLEQNLLQRGYHKHAGIEKDQVYWNAEPRRSSWNTITFGAEGTYFFEGEAAREARLWITGGNPDLPDTGCLVAIIDGRESGDVVDRVLRWLHLR